MKMRLLTFKAYYLIFLVDIKLMRVEDAVSLIEENTRFWISYREINTQFGFVETGDFPEECKVFLPK